MLKRFNIKIRSEFEEQLLGFAERFGISAFSSPVIRDAGVGETDFEFTGTTVVSFVLSSTEQNPEMIEAEVRKWLNDYDLPQELEIEEYSETQDWMAGFREHFKPMIVGTSIVIRPPWAEPLSQEADATTIVIDPGMAFGTGTHETTRLCLQLLEKKNLAGQFFLDLGAGSGILSFYLMKKGANAGIAIEIEGAAVENMKKNAALNGISDRLKMICTDIGSFTPEIKADGLVANITSPVILENLPLFSSWVKPGGWGVFSGVNSTNAEAVKDAFVKNGWENLEEIVEGDWHGFALTRN